MAAVARSHSHLRERPKDSINQCSSSQAEVHSLHLLLWSASTSPAVFAQEEVTTTLSCFPPRPVMSERVCAWRVTSDLMGRVAATLPPEKMPFEAASGAAPRSALPDVGVSSDGRKLVPDQPEFRLPTVLCPLEELLLVVLG